MDASASGPISDASTPMREKSKEPSTRNARQPVSVWGPLGMVLVGAIIDNSLLVYVSDASGLGANQFGIDALGGSRQIAKCSDKMQSVSLGPEYSDVIGGV